MEREKGETIDQRKRKFMKTTALGLAAIATGEMFGGEPEADDEPMYYERESVLKEAEEELKKLGNIKNKCDQRIEIVRGILRRIGEYKTALVAARSHMFQDVYSEFNKSPIEFVSSIEKLLSSVEIETFSTVLEAYSGELNKINESITQWTTFKEAIEASQEKIRLNNVLSIKPKTFFPDFPKIPAKTYEEGSELVEELYNLYISLLKARVSELNERIGKLQGANKNLLGQIHKMIEIRKKAETETNEDLVNFAKGQEQSHQEMIDENNSTIFALGDKIEDLEKIQQQWAMWSKMVEAVGKYDKYSDVQERLPVEITKKALGFE